MIAHRFGSKSKAMLVIMGGLGAASMCKYMYIIIIIIVVVVVVVVVVVRRLHISFFLLLLSFSSFGFSLSSSSSPDSYTTRTSSHHHTSTPPYTLHTHILHTCQVDSHPQLKRIDADIHVDAVIGVG